MIKGAKGATAPLAGLALIFALLHAKNHCMKAYFGTSVGMSAILAMWTSMFFTWKGHVAQFPFSSLLTELARVSPECAFQHLASSGHCLRFSQCHVCAPPHNHVGGHAFKGVDVHLAITGVGRPNRGYISYKYGSNSHRCHSPDRRGRRYILLHGK